MATYYQREFKKKDGTTYKRWCAEVNINYKKKTFYGKTKKEVSEKVKSYETDMNIYGNSLDNTPITLSEWTYTHLFTNMLPSVSPSTFERYKGIYDHYIVDSDLGSMAVKNIRQIHLQEYFNGLTTLSNGSMKKIKFVLNGALKSAISNNLIRTNPLDELKLPTSQKEDKQIKVFTLEQQKNYISALQDERNGFLFYLTLYTGLRLAEVIGLKWKYVDFNAKTITVMETIKRSKVYNSDGEYEVQNVTKAPKSVSGKREIPIPSFLLTQFKEQKLRSHSEYVFSTSTGTPIDASNIRRTHQRICKKANIKNISFHALRHTYATRLIEAGENIKTVQILLGHADISTTMNIYTHVLHDTKMSAADKLNAIHEKMFLNA